MKYLLLFLILAGCASTQQITSGSLREMAAKSCKDVPTLDMQQMMCEYALITTYCKINDPDIKLCESLREK